jgi:hypothetical protein
VTLAIPNCRANSVPVSSFCFIVPPPARKTIDLEGRIVKDGVRKALRDRQIALVELVHAVREYRRIAENKPLTLRDSKYPQAVRELNKAIDRAEGSLIANLSLGKMPLR